MSLVLRRQSRVQFPSVFRLGVAFPIAKFAFFPALELVVCCCLCTSAIAEFLANNDASQVASGTPTAVSTDRPESVSMPLQCEWRWKYLLTGFLASVDVSIELAESTTIFSFEAEVQEVLQETSTARMSLRGAIRKSCIAIVFEQNYITIEQKYIA